MRDILILTGILSGILVTISLFCYVYSKTVLIDVSKVHPASL